MRSETVGAATLTAAESLENNAERAFNLAKEVAQRASLACVDVTAADLKELAEKAYEAFQEVDEVLKAATNHVQSLREQEQESVRSGY